MNAPVPHLSRIFPRARRPALVGALAAVLCCAAVHASASSLEAASVDDFALLDQHGRFHRLSGYVDAKAIVIFVQGNGCPIARGAVPVLEDLKRTYASRGVVFLALNANPQDDRSAVLKESAEFGLTIPILMDETQVVAESLGVTRTAEALVIDPVARRVRYRGPIDDRLHYEAQKPASQHFLRDALEDVLAERPVAAAAGESPGCLIFFPHRKEREVGALTFTQDIAPIVSNRCVSCHREGGVAPFALTRFEVVQGWSPMIRETVRTKRMPPWHADPHIGRFSNDISLSNDEARKLVHWVEAGAPRGSGPDPLIGDAVRKVSTAPSARDAAGASDSEWALGEPDLVLEAKPQDIPATGVVAYRYETVRVPIEKRRWLRAVDIRPTNPAVTHHATAHIVPPRGREAPEVEGPQFVRGFFAGFVPGREPMPFPEDTGFRIEPGSKIRFQLHYTTTGRKERDTPRIGLYFALRQVTHELKIGAVVNTTFEIPAGARDHEDTAERRLNRDIIVYRLTPHMHFRGSRMSIEAHFEGGGSETLLNVPNYNFNWQRQYKLAEPRLLERGTRIVAVAGFDNSTRNAGNPDPTHPVYWGEQSFEEMLIGYFLYRDAKPSRSRRHARW